MENPQTVFVCVFCETDYGILILNQSTHGNSIENKQERVDFQK